MKNLKTSLNAKTLVILTLLSYGLSFLLGRNTVTGSALSILGLLMLAFTVIAFVREWQQQKSPQVHDNVSETGTNQELASDLNEKPWYRFLKVVFIVSYIFVLTVVAVFAEGATQPSLRVDSEKTIIQCNNGKSYRASDASIFITSASGVSSYEDKDARKLCAYGIIKDYLDKYSAPEIKNYKVHLESTSDGSWSKLMMVLLGSLGVAYVTFVAIQVAFFYVIKRTNPLTVIASGFKQHIVLIGLVFIITILLSSNSYRSNENRVQSQLQSSVNQLQGSN